MSKIENGGFSRKAGPQKNYQRRVGERNFDNAAFIEDVYQEQRAFRRRDDDEVKIKELITYVICRIKQRLNKNIPKDHQGVTFQFKQTNAPKAIRTQQ